jgi:hypothetical protein
VYKRKKRLLNKFLQSKRKRSIFLEYQMKRTDQIMREERSYRKKKKREVPKDCKEMKK